MADAILGQKEVNIMLTPGVIGWGLQLILSGSATTLGFALLQKKAVIIQRFGRIALYAAIIANLGASAVNIVEFWHYTTLQNRTAAGLVAFHTSDALAPLFPGIVALITQAFLSLRCYRISRGRCWPIAIILATGCAVGFAAAIWTTLASLMWSLGHEEYFAQLFPSYQLVLWSNFLTDLLICGLTIYHLHRLRNGSATTTDRFVKSLLRLAFQTAALPCVATAATAVILCATYTHRFWWNLYNVILPILPSLYVFSLIFCLSSQVKYRDEHEEERRKPQPLTEMSWAPPRQWDAEVVPALGKIATSDKSMEEKTRESDGFDIQILRYNQAGLASSDTKDAREEV